MKLAAFWYSLFTGKGRLKLQFVTVGLLVVIALFAIVLVSAHREAAKVAAAKTPFLTQKVNPPDNLDYNIIEIDTIPFEHINVAKNGSEEPRPGAPATGRRAEEQPPAARKPARQPVRRTAPSQNASIPASPIQGGSSKMIIVNNLNPESSPASQSSLAGLQSVRLKVIVPQKTPVTTGSLVEARVIHESRFGNIVIPRRSKLLGTARLQNSRVEVDFREIRIRNKTYSCSGRAYDLKSLPGISYNPLNARAKQVLFDELKTAAAGVPVVGRLVNQPDFNPVTQEITSLDEGQEFFVLVTNIF